MSCQKTWVTKVKGKVMPVSIVGGILKNLMLLEEFYTINETSLIKWKLVVMIISTINYSCYNLTGITLVSYASKLPVLITGITLPLPSGIHFSFPV